MHTHPGLPGPSWEPYKTRQEYQEASGTTFQIDRICMVGNTGTYLDSPYHRYADGGDLASVPLSQVVEVPIIVIDARGQRAVGIDTVIDAVGDESITGAAVLLYTAGNEHWGEEKYALDAPYVTAAAANWLAQRRHRQPVTGQLIDAAGWAGAACLVLAYGLSRATASARPSAHAGVQRGRWAACRGGHGLAG